MRELTQEEIKSIKDHYDRLSRYEEKLAIARKRNKEDIDKLVSLVNEILNRNQVGSLINNAHICFSGGYIGNIENTADKKLSSIIFDSIFPIPKQKLFSHYTSVQGATSILQNKEFRLFNLINNFKDNEFRLFYEEHNIDGYKTMGEVFGVKTDYKSLMSEIFALCLTSPDNESDDIWEYFGFNGTGLKLTFEIESYIPDFREVYYSDVDKSSQIPLLKDLFQTIQTAYQLPLNFSYISKIGAFYIQGKFTNEKEYRFLVKRTSDNYNASNFEPIVYFNDITYITIPFESKLAKFKLVSVKKGPNCSESNFNQIKVVVEENFENVNFEL